MLRHSIAILGLAALAGTASVASAAEAGRVTFVTGKVQVGSRAVVLDAAVQEGDEINTGADGYIYVKTVDNGFLVLRPNSSARITAYHVDTKNPANTRVKLELLKGTARSISGAGVKQARQSFRFNTPVAAIGVRGTDFIVFTDQQTSRVAVVSGGVVVSGFSATCGPEGAGPCEGNASRELFAGQSGMLLQVQRGHQAPQLLQGPTLVPDPAAPPRSDEPVGAANPLPSPSVSLDVQKVAALLPKTPATPTPPTDDNAGKPTLPPVEPVRSLPEVNWGRWEAVAGVSYGPENMDKLSSTTNKLMFTGSYAIGRLKDATFVMPRDGTASFQLQSSEALVIKAGQDAVKAAVESPRLDVDFARQTFSTALTLATADTKYSITGKGDLSYTGELLSNGSSNSVVRGFLGGARAEEAGYIFVNTSNPGVTLTGATKWSR